MAINSRLKNRSVKILLEAWKNHWWKVIKNILKKMRAMEFNGPLRVDVSTIQRKRLLIDYYKLKINVFAKNVQWISWQKVIKWNNFLHQILVFQQKMMKLDSNACSAWKTFSLTSIVSNPVFINFNQTSKMVSFLQKQNFKLKEQL